MTINIEKESTSMNAEDHVEKDLGKDDDMRSFSLACHLYSHLKFGGVEALKSIHLEDHHFQEILDLAGPDSQFRLLKKKSTRYYKDLWSNRNFGLSNDVDGHSKKGQLIHSPTVSQCTYNHCKIGEFHTDLVCMTPPSSKLSPHESRQSSKKKENVARNLFRESLEKNGNINIAVLPDFGARNIVSPSKEELKKV